MEPTAVLHAQSEYEWRGAKEVAGHAEGEGAEAPFSEHHEPKTATRYVGMLRQIVLYDFGEVTQLIGRIEQFRHLVRKYEGQSGVESLWQTSWLWRMKSAVAFCCDTLRLCGWSVTLLG